MLSSLISIAGENEENVPENPAIWPEDKDLGIINFSWNESPLAVSYQIYCSETLNGNPSELKLDTFDLAQTTKTAYYDLYKDELSRADLGRPFYYRVLPIAGGGGDEAKGEISSPLVGYVPLPPTGLISTVVPNLQETGLDVVVKWTASVGSNVKNTLFTV